MYTMIQKEWRNQTVVRGQYGFLLTYLYLKLGKEVKHLLSGAWGTSSWLLALQAIVPGKVGYDVGVISY